MQQSSRVRQVLPTHRYTVYYTHNSKKTSQCGYRRSLDRTHSEDRRSTLILSARRVQYCVMEREFQSQPVLTRMTPCDEKWRRPGYDPYKKKKWRRPSVREWLEIVRLLQNYFGVVWLRAYPYAYGGDYRESWDSQTRFHTRVWLHH